MSVSLLQMFRWFGAFIGPVIQKTLRPDLHFWITETNLMETFRWKLTTSYRQVQLVLKYWVYKFFVSFNRFDLLLAITTGDISRSLSVLYAENQLQWHLPVPYLLRSEGELSSSWTLSCSPCQKIYITTNKST